MLWQPYSAFISSVPQKLSRCFKVSIAKQFAYADLCNFRAVILIYVLMSLILKRINFAAPETQRWALTSCHDSSISNKFSKSEWKFLQLTLGRFIKSNMKQHLHITSTASWINHENKIKYLTHLKRSWAQNDFAGSVGFGAIFWVVHSTRQTWLKDETISSLHNLSTYSM